MPEGAASKKPKVEKAKIERKADGLGTRISRFLTDSYVEVFKKCAWPSWPELQKFTAVVIVTLLVVAIYVGGLDYLLSKLTNNLLFKRQ
jgi:preprotein translocase subunit SecE